MNLVDTLHKWTTRKKEDRLLHEFGGIQKCPWCKQIANQNDSWKFEPYDKDPICDVLTCGVCSGTSLWRFELGMIYMGPLDPPKAK